MGLFDKLFGTQRQKKPNFEHVKKNVDPSTHYDLVGKLGEGAFGDVWKAKNRITQKYAAAKIIETGSEAEIEEHYGEIEILMKCNHQNIVKCVDSMYYENKLWILIEYCEGGALDDIIEKIDHGLSEEQCRVVVCRTVAGLEYLHSQPIIHRDLKAGNILLLSNGEIKLADFGVSALNTTQEQMRDTFIGTPYWMAPEVIMCETSKSDPYTYSADVWSLGITIIELIQMEPPHNEFSPNRVLMKIARGEAPRLRNSSDYSFPMNKFVEICLQKNPLDRPTCAELIENQWIVSVESNKPLRQLLAETRAEVLEEVIKQNDIKPSLSQKTAKPGGSLPASSSAEESADQSADELTAYEKGIQKKFNSVSSSISSSSSVGGQVQPTVGVTVVTEVTQNGANGVSNGDKINDDERKIQNVTKNVEKVEVKPIKIDENDVNEVHAVEDGNIEIIETNIVKINRLDGSVSGTVFGPKVSNDQKPSAIEIARRISISEKSNPNRRRSSLGSAISPSSPHPQLQKSNTVDIPTPTSPKSPKQLTPTLSPTIKSSLSPDTYGAAKPPKSPRSNPTSPSHPMKVTHPLKNSPTNEKAEKTEKSPEKSEKELIEPKSGGTWFGSKKSSKTENRPIASEAIKNIETEKLKEQNVLKELDEATLDRNENQQTNKPKNIDRRGATRDSYKNATEPETGNESPKMKSISEEKPKEKVMAPPPPGQKSVPLKTDEERSKDEKAKRQKKTLKRTRKFILDGEEVTVTSTVTQSDADVERQSEKRILRRQELQELRKLQIEEQRKMAALQHKLGSQTEQLTQKCERQIYELNRLYTQKIESLERNQKIKIEKMEATQGKEQKEMVAGLKKEQQRELDAFSSNMKQEQSELKKQVAAQFSDRKSRQNTFKSRKTQLDQHQKYKEGAFRAKQEDRLNEATTKFNEDQKKAVAETERSALIQRQELLRERESKIWDTEESHLQEKHQTARSQLKDQFLLQKMLLVVRHDKEMEQVTRHNERLQKALEDRQRADRARLPKWQRNDGKTRESMFKQSIRIQNPNIDPKEELEKMKEFKTNEEKRQDNERLRQQQKHERQTQELSQKCEANINELKQIQNEKRRLLVETETEKLKSLDESFKKKFEHWRDKLGPRKQELEEQFSKQMLEWEQFFSQQDLPQTPSGSKRLSNFYRIS